MSFINDALAKAQTEKDNRFLHAEGILQTNPIAGRFRFRYRHMAAVLALFVVAACVVFFMIWPVSAPISQPRTAAHPVPPAAAGNPSPEASRIYMDALNHQRNGDYHIADILYRQVLTLEPNHPYALNNLGVLNMIQQMPDKAIVLFQRAIALKSDYVHPYYNLACIYAKQNKVDESLLQLEKAIALKPEIVEWAAKDKDFKPLRQHPSFTKLVGKQAR